MKLDNENALRRSSINILKFIKENILQFLLLDLDFLQFIGNKSSSDSVAYILSVRYYYPT